MPSIEESKEKVKAGLETVNNEVDHDAILASLEREIDKHNNAAREDKDVSEHACTGRFRFKSSASENRKRKHSPGHRSRHHHHKRRSHRHDRDSQHEAAHPFPREPFERDDRNHRDPDLAFRESLFDALADDEGAAYWENVYSQPIHVYPRPTVKTPQGELEEMNDDEYAAYVQTKMWEKKHPHIIDERDRREKRRRQEEEERTRRREEFVRRKQKAAWERAEREGASRFAGMDDDEDKTDNYDYVFDHEATMNSAAESLARKQSERANLGQAWKDYLAAWGKLKHELLVERGSSSQDANDQRGTEERIPWPVLSRKPVVKKNIEDFMRWITVDQDERSKLQLLKAERVRWHPDKVLQLFKGQVDESTVKLITLVFQVVDALFEVERGREHKTT